MTATPHESGFVAIAHRGGNSRRALTLALAAAVDWIEIDVWLHYGRLVARHDRALWRLPVTYSRRRVSLQLAPAVVLSTAIEATDTMSTHQLVDLKGNEPGLPDAIVQTLAERGALGRAALCGQNWRPLDRARSLRPDVEVIFSLGRPEHLSAYLSRRRDGSAPPVTSCYHGLLTPATVDALKGAGSTIFAWTVDDVERARTLLAWGVDGIISNDYGMLAGLRGWPPPPARSRLRSEPPRERGEPRRDG
jgi:glycerophosphoryl diester phosphodiesterase